MASLHNPPHPGEALKEDILPKLGLSVTEAAAQLGVSRAAQTPRAQVKPAVRGPLA